MSNLPIQFIDKENSPALLAFMQQFGEHTYVDAELINKFRDAINELYLSSNPDRIISIGTEIKDGNQYTYVDYQWMINGQIFDNYNNPQSLLINSTTPGYKRNDIGILTSTGDVMQVQGEETNGEVVTTPDVPPGSILLKIYNVVGDQITIDPTPIIVGDKFIEKTDFLVHNFVGSGSDVVIPLLANGASEIRLQSGLTPLISIDGFDLSLITGNPDAKVPYNGKIFLIRNTASAPITLKNFGDADFKFYSLSGSDVVIPVNGIITVKYGFGGGESSFTEYFRNWTEPIDLSQKADLVGGKVPASQLPSYVDDVIEGYFNGTNFYTDAGFTNLITPESSKIYVALDTNFTYRWSGSAYVQIGGSTEEIWNTSRYANWRILKAEALGGNQGAIGFTNNLTFTNIGTVSLKPSTYNTGNFIDTIRRIGLTSASTAGAEVQRRVTSGVSCSTKSGFYFCADTISEDAATVATVADLIGLGNAFLSPFGNIEPSTTTACVLLAYDSTDTNMQIMHNDNFGTCTKIDLGVNFPARTNATDLYRLELYCATNGVEINYRVTRLNTGDKVSGTLTTNIPTSAIPLTLGFWRGNRSTALAVTKSFSQITIATPY